MAGWRLVVEGNESLLFSGCLADIEQATLQELKSNPRVVWWRKRVERCPLLYVLDPVQPSWVCGVLFNTATQQHGLFGIEIERSLFPVANDLEEANELTKEAYRLLRGDESKLEGASHRIYWENARVLFYDWCPDMLTSKARDWRSAERVV